MRTVEKSPSANSQPSTVNDRFDFTKATMPERDAVSLQTRPTTERLVFSLPTLNPLADISTQKASYQEALALLKQVKDALTNHQPVRLNITCPHIAKQVAAEVGSLMQHRENPYARFLDVRVHGTQENKREIQLALAQSNKIVFKEDWLNVEKQNKMKQDWALSKATDRLFNVLGQTFKLALQSVIKSTASKDPYKSERTDAKEALLESVVEGLATKVAMYKAGQKDIKCSLLTVANKQQLGYILDYFKRNNVPTEHLRALEIADKYSGKKMYASQLMQRSEERNTFKGLWSEFKSAGLAFSKAIREHYSLHGIGSTLATIKSKFTFENVKSAVNSFRTMVTNRSVPLEQDPQSFGLGEYRS